MQILTKITNNICDNLLPAEENKSDTIECLKEIKDGLVNFSNSRELTKTAQDKIKRSITQIDYYMHMIISKEEDDNEE